MCLLYKKYQHILHLYRDCWMQNKFSRNPYTIKKINMDPHLCIDSLF